MTRTVYTLTITDYYGGSHVHPNMGAVELHRRLNDFLTTSRDIVFVITQREVDETEDAKIIRVPSKAVLPGDSADHISGQLDPREVVRTDDNFVYLDILGQTCGPFPKSNYTFTRMIGGQA